MDYSIPPLLYAVLMLAGMLVCLGAGQRLGIRWLACTPGGKKPSFGSLEGPIFALFGLLVAFTFSGAPARLDQRRHLIAQEANAIGTAYLRIDLLSADEQPAMRDRFRRYLDSRLLAYSKLPDVDAAMGELRNTQAIQNDIWTSSIAAARDPAANPEATKLILPALNDMIDITTTRLAAARMHPPFVIFVLLFVTSMVISLLAGFGMADHPRRSWLHLVAYALVPVIVVFVILEIEYPRMGILPAASSMDQVLVELRETMK